MTASIALAIPYHEHRETNDPSVDVDYIVNGTDSLTEIYALIAGLPLLWNDLPLVSWDLDAIEGLADCWRVRMHYGRIKPYEQTGGVGGPPGTWDPGAIDTGFKFQYEIGTSSERIFVSKETVGTYDCRAIPARVNDPPNFQKAIGVTEEGIDGVEIDVSNFVWSETYKLYSPTYMSPGYVRAVADLIDLTPINNATFRTFPRGEVKVLSVTGMKESQPTAELTFRFHRRANRTNLKIGLSDNISKEGWQYLWIYMKETRDTNAKKTIRTPLAAYVERVYDYGDFGALQIGN